jgi:hypothetical protein
MMERRIEEAMKIKIRVILILAALIGGAVVVLKMSDDKPKRKSDFFKNEAKDIDVKDGKQY